MGKVVTITWPSHGKDLVKGIWKLLKEGFKTDFEISINGCYLQAHHLILAIFCPVIKESQNHALILGEISNVSKSDVEMMFEFLYRGQLDVDEDRLPSLKEIADKLGFTILANIIQRFQSVKSKISNSKRKKSRSKEENYSVTSNETENSNDFELQETRAAEPAVDDSTDEMKVDDKELPNDLCSGAFNSKTNKFYCRICGSGFARSMGLYKHLKVHEKRENKLTCTHCEYKTFDRTRLGSHMINAHQVDLQGNPQPKTIKCPEPQCSFVCSADFQLKNHTYQKHSFKRKVCESCGYRCQSDAVLRTHKLYVHSDLKPHECAICGYRAKVAQQLRKHMRIHEPSRVTCDICGASVSANHISQHRKIHSSEPKSHSCPLCNFTSWKNWNLKIHLRSVHKIEVDTCKQDLSFLNSDAF